MKYNCTLEKKFQTAPVLAILELEIPDNLDDEERIRFATHELMKAFRVEIDPIQDEKTNFCNIRFVFNF